MKFRGQGEGCTWTLCGIQACQIGGRRREFIVIFAAVLSSFLAQLWGKVEVTQPNGAVTVKAAIDALSVRLLEHNYDPVDFGLSFGCMLHILTTMIDLLCG